MIQIASDYIVSDAVFSRAMHVQGSFVKTSVNSTPGEHEHKNVTEFGLISGYDPPIRLRDSLLFPSLGT